MKPCFNLLCLEHFRYNPSQFDSYRSTVLSLWSTLVVLRLDWLKWNLNETCQVERTFDYKMNSAELVQKWDESSEERHLTNFCLFFLVTNGFLRRLRRRTTFVCGFVYKWANLKVLKFGALFFFCQWCFYDDDDAQKRTKKSSTAHSKKFCSFSARQKIDIRCLVFEAITSTTVVATFKLINALV